MSAASLNTITLIGRLGRDPEEVHAGQIHFARLSVATDDGYRDQSGQKVERTTWHSVTVGGKTAENCSRFLHKGSIVCVEGRYLSRKHQTKDGRDAVSFYVTASRVVFLDRREDDTGNGGNRGGREQGRGGACNDDWKY